MIKAQHITRGHAERTGSEPEQKWCSRMLVSFGVAHVADAVIKAKCSGSENQQPQ